MNVMRIESLSCFLLTSLREILDTLQITNDTRTITYVLTATLHTPLSCLRVDVATIITNCTKDIGSPA